MNIDTVKKLTGSKLHEGKMSVTRVVFVNRSRSLLRCPLCRNPCSTNIYIVLNNIFHLLGQDMGCPDLWHMPCLCISEQHNAKLFCLMGSPLEKKCNKMIQPSASCFTTVLLFD